MRLRLGFLGFILAILCCSHAFGQAVVDGRIINGNSLKPVAGVTVHLVNGGKDVGQPQVTATDGSYTFDNVPPGPGYTVNIFDVTGKLIGLDTSKIGPFTVEDGKEHTAFPEIDISKGVTADREKNAGGLIALDRGVSPGSNITNTQLRVLPLFNRNFLSLGLIQPGVHDVEQGSPLQGAAFSIAGSRSTSTNFLLDGVDNVASGTNQAIPFQINEAVREFRVIYANPSVRYGQGSGGVVDVLTSNGFTGSKGWHGHLFGYFNSDALNADTPLSVYSNTGFAKASAYAGGINSTSLAISASAAGSTNCQTDVSLFCGYAPQSYNALFNLVKPSNVYGLDAGCTTQLCQAGAFNPGALPDSHVEPFNSKQFGASVGGPLGSKLFLFISYEGTLINNPTSTFERVPTFMDKNPAAGVNAADSRIAQGLLGVLPTPNVGQTGAALATGTNAGIFGFYQGLAPNYTNVHNITIRPDVSLGTLGTVSLRYTGQLLDQLHDDTLPASSSYPGNGADRRAQNQSAALTYSLPFGKSVNQFTVAFTQYRVDEVAQDRGFNASSLGLPGGAMPTVVISGIDTRTSGAKPGTPGLVGGWYDSFWETCQASSSKQNCPNAAATNRSPSPITPSLDGDFPLARIGAPQSAPSKHRDTEVFVADALELHPSSRSTLTVGGDYRYQQNFSYDGGLARGLIVSNNIGEFTSDSETCISCGATTGFQHPSFDYELRQPTGYTGDLRSSSFGIFAEHKFQPTPRLTIVTGVRYDYFGQPLDTQNRLWNYNVNNQGLNRQGATGTFDAFDYQCGGGATFFDSVYGSLRASTPVTGWSGCNPQGNFQLPSNNHDITGQIGFAYSPTGSRDVLRAAVGGYYDHLPASYNQKLLLNRPSPYNVSNPSSIYGQNFGSTFTSPNCVQSTQCAFGLNTLNFGSFAAGSAAQSTFQNYQASSGANIMYERDPNALSTPYTVQISASYQHSFTGSWVGEIGYVGSLGRQLPLVYDGNYANEFYCSQAQACNNDTYFPVFTESHIGQSTYNSFVARVEGRLWHGLSMHAAYTFAKSLDNIAGSSFPNSTDSLFTQLFGRQLFGSGNPAAFAVQASQSGNGSNNGLRGSELAPVKNGQGVAVPSAFAQNVLQSANIPSFDSIQSALTTTGSRVINTSHYSIPQNPLAFSSNGALAGADYGPSDFDVRHRGVADLVYNLPDFGHKWVGGFTLSAITIVQSGQPFTIFSGPAYGQISQLANISSSGFVTTTGKPTGDISLGSASLLSALPSVGNANCPNIYAQPQLFKFGATPAACLGNSSRNEFTGPAYFSQDLALQKSTRLFSDSSDLVLRVEGYNIFNRSNYYNPISEISKDGVHVNPEFGLIRSAHDPFRLQLAVRVDF